MKTFRSIALLSTLAATGYAVAACADNSPTQPAAHVMAGGAMSDMSSGHDGGVTGTTAGWSAGQTVTFFYSKPFFCQQPPSSGATSACELGADGTVAPRSGSIPVLYVLVPLGFTPPASTLQCAAGNCVDHPRTIDLSRVFGAGTENALLPAHSHVIGDEPNASRANGGWWDVNVIGVTTLAGWNQIVANKNLATVRALQAANSATGDIPTNLDLFFSTRP